MGRFLTASLLGIILSTFPLLVNAAGDPCILQGLPCLGQGGLAAGSQGLVDAIKKNFIDFLRYAFVGIAGFMLFYYAFNLLFASEDENALTQTKTAYAHAIAGCAIVSIATILADQFATQTFPINPLEKTGNINPLLENIITYFKLVVGLAVSFHVTYQGIRLIALQGKEEEVTKQKTRFFHGLLGVGVVLLAVKIADAAGGSKSAAILPAEIKGIADFLLPLFGILVVVAFIASAALVLLSVEEEMKEKGKKGMIGSVVALAIVFSAWAIVQYVLGFQNP